MDNRFHGLNKVDKDAALLVYQRGLIWLNHLEKMINEDTISKEAIEKEGYLKGIEHGLIEKDAVSLEEYINECYRLLRIYIQITRALFLGEDEKVSQFGGYSVAKKTMEKIGDAYHFLLEKLRKDTNNIDNNESLNVQSILSGEYKT